MEAFFACCLPVVQALLGTLFTWGLTALGAALVFFFKSINKRMLNGMLGFAAGVMIAASFWSLLQPALEMASNQNMNAWLVASVGFLGGGAFLYIVDKTLPHLHIGLQRDQAEGVKTTWQRSVLLVLAITLHNIPEGLAVGVAFGAAAFGLPSATLASAMVLALGIGIQNFPEGAAVSIPLRREGMSRAKAFLYGQASGIVEPIAGVLGTVLVLAMQARSALRAGLCRRRDDLRRGGGVDTRIPAERGPRVHGHIHHRLHGRFRSYDGAGCLPG